MRFYVLGLEPVCLLTKRGIKMSRIRLEGMSLSREITNPYQIRAIFICIRFSSKSNI